MSTAGTDEHPDEYVKKLESREIDRFLAVDHGEDEEHYDPKHCTKETTMPHDAPPLPTLPTNQTTSFVEFNGVGTEVVEDGDSDDNHDSDDHHDDDEDDDHENHVVEEGSKNARMIEKKQSSITDTKSFTDILEEAKLNVRPKRLALL